MGKKKYEQYGHNPGHLFNEETSGCTPQFITTIGLLIIFIFGKAFLRD